MMKIIILYKVVLRSKRDEDWARFKEAAKETRKLLTNTRATFIKKKLEETDGNPSKFWREIKNVLGINNHDSDYQIKIKDDNQDFVEDAKLRV